MMTYEEHLENELRDPAFAEAYQRLALPSAIAIAVVGTLHLGIFPSKVMEIAQRSILTLR